MTSKNNSPSKIPSEYDCPDFTVNVEENRDIVILQLTDLQIIDASQARTENRLSAYEKDYWAPEKMDERCFLGVRETIEAVKPDLILITGDLVYGEFDDAGTSFAALIEFMDSFRIPWAPVFGNHDNESKIGADRQSHMLENAQHCLFRQRNLTGNGNYTVGISHGGKLKRVFFMLDSNGTGGLSPESLANGHSSPYAGFGQDQIEWYTKTGREIKTLSPDCKISFAFHIQPAIFASAFRKYGFTNSGTVQNPINIDLLENAEEGDFGYLGNDLKSAWDNDFTVYETIKVLGTDSIFAGHEHCNSASVVYDGIRFQYGQKSSTYDRANYITEDGHIVGSYSKKGIPVVGGTVVNLADNGSIKEAHIFLCKNTCNENSQKSISVNTSTAFQG